MNEYKPLQWIEHPFASTSLELIDDSSYKEIEEMIETQCSSHLKLEFGEKSLPDFWMARLTEFPHLASKAVETLTAFPTTWMCESAFSRIHCMKTKYRNALDIQHDARVALSNTEPDIGFLVQQST